MTRNSNPSAEPAEAAAPTALLPAAEERPERGIRARLDLKVTFKCNNSCRFCILGDRKKAYRTLDAEEVKEALRQRRPRSDGVVFTGGEPTMRKDLPELVRFAREVGYSIVQIQSNGRMFAYPSFIERLLEAGANEFAVSLHGHTPELHDSLTRSKGSFVQAVSGIRRLGTLRQPVLTNTVITKPNHRHLPAIARLLTDLAVRQSQFAFPHIAGDAEKNLAEIVPRKSEVIEYVKAALHVLLDTGIIATTEAIPFCFLRGLEHCCSERLIPKTEIYDDRNVMIDSTRERKTVMKIKGPPCRMCVFSPSCEGPWKEYPETFGWSEFVPVTQEETENGFRLGGGGRKARGGRRASAEAGIAGGNRT